MRRLALTLGGVLLGAAIGTVLVALFAPATGEEFRKRLREGYQETLVDARHASEKRTAELEAQLARLQGKN